jgi:hypothetical protein
MIMNFDEQVYIAFPIICYSALAVAYWLAFSRVRQLSGSRRRVAARVLAVILTVNLLLFFEYVWPTPWRYWADNDFDYRTDRRTGAVEIQTGSEWFAIPHATEQQLRKDGKNDDDVVP